MQQTDNAQRTDNAPPYDTARLPIPLTPYVTASTYIAAYQQQLLEGTSPGPLQQLRTCNVLNIIINATGTFPHTLRLIIQTTDKLQAHPSTITVHLHRAYYLQDLQHEVNFEQSLFCLYNINNEFVRKDN